ncbi:hypothetical protein PTKIN_Ptkin16aG0059400 [Pterospermum kingtungense]
MAPEYTDCTIKNFSGKVLKLHSIIIWDGSYQCPSTTLVNRKMDQFRHHADYEGSVGGLLYEFEDGGHKFKWIIAWTNARGKHNKVYTQILENCDVVEWHKIKDILEKSGQECRAQKSPYAADITIFDIGSPRATMTATLYIN